MTDNTDTPTAQFFAGTPEYEDARRRFRPGRPPRTPQALPTREQIAALVRFWAETYDAVARGSDESLYADDSDMPESIADAVLPLIDKENTMPDRISDVPELHGTASNKANVVQESTMPDDVKGTLCHRREPHEAHIRDVHALTKDGWVALPTKCPGVPDDTIPVPRALIERAKEALIEVPPSSRNADIYGDLHALLDPPKPSAPRLRVVRLGSEHSTYETIRHETAHVFVDLEAQPDVLTVIDAAVAAVLDSTDTESVMDSIRAALGVE